MRRLHPSTLPPGIGTLLHGLSAMLPRDCQITTVQKKWLWVMVDDGEGHKPQRESHGWLSIKVLRSGRKRNTRNRRNLSTTNASDFRVGTPSGREPPRPKYR